MKKYFHQSLVLLILLCTLFSALSCTSKKQPVLNSCLTAEEKADLEYFFRMLLFENYGAFVLYGSKPLCEMSLFDSSTDPLAFNDSWKKALVAIDPEKQAELHKKLETKTREPMERERNLYQGWLAWEKASRNLKPKRYILSIHPSSSLGHYHVYLANIQEASLVLAENYTIFKEAAGMDFHPLQAVFDLENPNSEFWKKVLSLPNHLSKGLIYGFGFKNALFGTWDLQYSDTIPSSALTNYVKSLPLKPSAKAVDLGTGSPTHFTIPIFGILEGDDTAKKYEKEKKAIEKIYQGHDLVEVTLQHLTST
ncbi:MAG: hypothetical protein JSS61_05955 [Verrucomicrobia bacterium]|nr:hypothetical protein [Verrucomicrobiota bacterium]